jgi:calcineurin-like phosphoesterase family protein
MDMSNEGTRVWFTADLHLGHGNIIRYCQRPHLDPDEKRRAAEDARGRWRVSKETVQRHDRALLDAINARVLERDTLWVLGDFCWGRRDEALHYRRQIRCENVYLVWGNHDHPSVGPVFDRTIEHGMIRVEDQDIWLCHYPLRSWNKRFHGSWHLYGHVHGRLDAEDRGNPSSLTKDVGVDACGYRPWNFDELRAYMAPRLAKFREAKDAMMRGEDGDLV